MNTRDKYFLYVGNAYPHKSLERLLEAVHSLQSTAYSINLILVGPEDYFYKKLKLKIKDMGFTDYVIFHGPATKGDLTDLYKKALALVFPSLMEGFGLPAVEAMANECLVLCSDIPVFHEVLGETAIYFDPQNTTDIADKMKMVIDNPERYEILKIKGQDWIKRYSWQRLAKETLDIYKSV